MSSRISIAAASGLSFLAIVGLIQGARAHVTFEAAEMPAESGRKAVLRVPHGCAGQATNAVRVTIPEGIIDVKPMPKAGWTLAVTRGAYAKGYMLFGKAVGEGVKEIVWSKGDLPDGFYDEFVFTMRAAGDLAGKTVPVPVVQDCASAKAEWTEVAAPGQNAHDLKSPAPTLRILAAQTAAAPQFRAGAIVVEAPWARATPAGAKVGGGYLTLRNAGAQPDRLVSFSSAASGRGELHEMTMAEGVMKMREIAGIEIPAGGTVELKPGGLHLMFVDLKGRIAEGAPVKARLVFEKAGSVDVEFRVAPIGAAGPAEGHTHH